MSYVIPLLIVVLLVAGFITFLVMNATRRGRGAGRGGQPASPGIGGDATPLGDTAEHAGPQTESGRTVGRPDAGGPGGTGRPVQSGNDGTGATGADSGGGTARVRRSGEGEGTERVEFEDVEPAGTGVRAGSAAPASEVAGERGEAEAADGPERDDVAHGRDEPEGDRLRREGEDDDRSRPASERLANREF
jgi:hypothetical protein